MGEEVFPIVIRQRSNAHEKKVFRWIPPMPPWEPLKKKVNSSLRIACVVEDRLFRGLQYEGEIFLLTPENWRYVLRYGKPDFLLMESIWTDVTGHWHLTETPSSPQYSEMVSMVREAQLAGVPTVFWMTKGHEYHEHYKEFARIFDQVFCADVQGVDRMAEEGIGADLLPPCVQPAIYNPFRDIENFGDFSINVLYDGWGDLDRFSQKLEVFEDVRQFGLAIIDSRYEIFIRRLEELPDYANHILGCVDHGGRVLALKHSKTYLTHEVTSATQITQQWMALEAAATRLPVIHHGKLGDGDIRKGIVTECADNAEFIADILRCNEDELYRERAGHAAWRMTLAQHTFSHRVQKICQKTGINHDWVEFPKASAITPTYRRDYLPRCVDTFNAQTYPNKELVIVFNGNDLPAYTELGAEVNRDIIRISNVPGELFAGACMNHGHQIATGEYCFRMDDDDYYGPNYLMDMMLNLRGVDADLFGKPMSVYYYFPNDGSIYLKTAKVQPYNLLTKANIEAGRRMTGNTVSGRRSFFLENPYPDEAHSAADSGFLLSAKLDGKIIVTWDSLNMVVERRDDQATHTWKVDSERLKKTMLRTPYPSLEDLFI